MFACFCFTGQWQGAKRGALAVHILTSFDFNRETHTLSPRGGTVGHAHGKSLGRTTVLVL